jgi:hypothetical protein
MMALCHRTDLGDDLAAGGLGQPWAARAAAGDGGESATSCAIAAAGAAGR